MTRYKLAYQQIARLGRNYWTVTLNGGKRPVCIAQTWGGALNYINRKLAKARKMREDRQARKAARLAGE